MVVKVSKALCQELTKIKDSGGVDMQNSRAVLEYAEKHGLMLAARAVRGNPRRYLECINDGMEVSEPGG
jgi:hypothetical protein